MASRRGPDNTVRIAFSGLINARNSWANVMFARLTTSSAITQADLDTWTSSMFTEWGTAFAPYISSAVTLTLAKSVLFTPGGGELISAHAGSTAGAGAADAEYDGACAVVSWLSSVYWRGGKPRTYIPVPTATLRATGDSLTATGVTNFTTAGAAFRTFTNVNTSGTITGSSHGFVSFRSGNAERVTPVFYPSTGAIVHTRLGTQRRRLGKWRQ